MGAVHWSEMCCGLFAVTGNLRVTIEEEQIERAGTQQTKRPKASIRAKRQED